MTRSPHIAIIGAIKNMEKFAWVQSAQCTQSWKIDQR